MGVNGRRNAPAALLPPRKGPPVPTVQEAGWASEPVWTQRIEEKSFAPAGDRTPVEPVQSVVRHYTDWLSWQGYVTTGVTRRTSGQIKAARPEAFCTKVSLEAWSFLQNNLLSTAQKISLLLRFQRLTAANVGMTALRYIVPCSFV
jgi:hypothetical protein